MSEFVLSRKNFQCSSIPSFQTSFSSARPNDGPCEREELTLQFSQHGQSFIQNTHDPNFLETWHSLNKVNLPLDLFDLKVRQDTTSKITRFENLVLFAPFLFPPEVALCKLHAQADNQGITIRQF